MSTHDHSGSFDSKELDRIKKSLEEVVKSLQRGKGGLEDRTMVEKLAEEVSRLRMSVEFDHERRISAIEEFLQQYNS